MSRILLLVAVVLIMTHLPAEAWRVFLPLLHGDRPAPTATATAAATTTPSGVHYVGPDGDDTGPGTLGRPWATLQHAADVAEAGETIFLRGGVYNESVVIDRGGVPGAPIVFAAYANETPVLDGTGMGAAQGIDIGEADWLTFEGLVVRNFGAFGFVAWGESDGITLRRMEFSGVETAVKFQAGGTGDSPAAEDLLLEDIYAHDYSGSGFDCGPGGPCVRLTIRRFRAIGPGKGDDTAVDGFAVESGSDVLVEDSTSVGHAGDGFDLKSDRSTLRRVVSLDQGRNGIKLWGRDSRLETSISAGNGLEGLVLEAGGSYTVLNCLIANSRLYGYTVGLGYDSSLATPITMRNTTISTALPENGGTLVFVARAVQLDADFNLYYAPNRADAVICVEEGDRCYGAEDISGGTWTAASGQDAHSRYAAPAFRDESAHDFHPTVASPGLDAGDCSVAPSPDLDGIPRPQGSGCDVGPYEGAG